MVTYRDDLEFMVRVLPTHYTCVLRKHGVHCYSEIGIDENEPNEEHWNFIVDAIKQNFGDRFQEIFHQTCTDHLKFTVYLKRIPEMERKLEEARKIAASSIVSGWHTPTKF